MMSPDDPNRIFNYRPSWDLWGLEIAQAVATRGDCLRRQIGAVVIDSRHRVVSTGYNGAPSGTPGCMDGACPRARIDVPHGSRYEGREGQCIAIHAEVNALIWGDPMRIDGGTMYVSAEPCEYCLKVLSGSGLTKVVWPTQYGGIKEIEL
jgi:dCMP deaminase